MPIAAHRLGWILDTHTHTYLDLSTNIHRFGISGAYCVRPSFTIVCPSCAQILLCLHIVPRTPQTEVFITRNASLWLKKGNKCS